MDFLFRKAIKVIAIWFVVGLVIVAAIVVAMMALLFPSKSKPVSVPTQIVEVAEPGLTLIEAAERAGKRSAGRIVEEKLGAHRAQLFINDLSGALGAAPTAEAPRPN